MKVQKDCFEHFFCFEDKEITYNSFNNKYHISRNQNLIVVL